MSGADTVREAREARPFFDWKQQYEERANQLEKDGAFGAADDIRTLVDGLVEWERDGAALVARLEQQEKALRWYADENNWTQPTPYGTRIFDDESQAFRDCGGRARAVLEGRA